MARPPHTMQRGATRQANSAQKQPEWHKQRFDSQIYFRQHRAFLIESLSRLIGHPLASTMTILVIAISLSLPGGLFVLLKNVQAVTDRWEQQSVISLYLHPNYEDTEALALSHQLSSRADVADVQYISKEEGLRYFEQSSGHEQILSTLPENPLPIVLKVIPKATVDLDSLPDLQALRDHLQSLPQVEYAQLDADWLQRLAAIIHFGQRFVYAISSLLVFAVLLIVGNTIRMAVEGRRDEVLVMKLVGATNSYIRRPFLYMGFWFGVLGGVFAVLCILLLSWWVSAPAARLIELYHAEFELQSFNAVEIIMCLTISAAIGTVGSWIAVSRHIRNIELQ